MGNHQDPRNRFTYVKFCQRNDSVNEFGQLVTPFGEKMNLVPVLHLEKYQFKMGWDSTVKCKYLEPLEENIREVFLISE